MSLFQEESWRDPGRTGNTPGEGEGAGGAWKEKSSLFLTLLAWLSVVGGLSVRSKGRAWERRQHSPAQGAWLRLVSSRPPGPQTFNPVR